MSGYKLNRRGNILTIWEFDDATKNLKGTLTVRCDKGVPKAVRTADFQKVLKNFGIEFQG